MNVIMPKDGAIHTAAVTIMSIMDILSLIEGTDWPAKNICNLGILKNICLLFYFF